MRAFWPPLEPAQADYEQLRAAAVAGLAAASPASAVFWRRGLAGLIARPADPENFVARLHPGRRPAWRPYSDPRLDLLADALELVLSVVPVGAAEQAR